ncbi:ATP-dependent DNA helicase MPH1 [Cryptococcus neoformans Bt1]|nr:ATP-dependent DNA helicase MPH1 [Cryptococcus neoformans var. grubii Bt1]
MSDDEFGDDSIFLDDSFLRQVDNISAQATACLSSSRNEGLRPASSIARNSRLATTVSRTASHNEVSPNRSQNAHGVGRTFSAPGPMSEPLPLQRPAAISRQQTMSKIPLQPSSDDYDMIDIPTESLAAFDAVIANPLKKPSRPALSGFPPKPSHSTSSSRNTSAPSRHPSSSNKQDNFHQTHLNWRSEPRYTKGKRWDRTQFAKTGRRIISLAGRDKVFGGKGKEREILAPGWEDDAIDEEQLMDDDMGDVLAPAPRDFNAPYGPQRQLPSKATIDTYIYPTNHPKRDYQFEIIRNCFLDNTLVALPTGLGKTFVAGVVMLNFYRWFPTGKIVFLAPTRPLVAQQIEACQLSCGIPSNDAAVMTGEGGSRKSRERLWEEKRVFYCTPQTLDNDLKNGAVDPRDIVLVVFDEAHKATGNYAYTTIVAYITAHHPYFRILALTATPGADVEKVQNVVDALHISRIEIREAEAPEIRKYMNTKHIEKHVVPMSDVIVDFRDRLSALMVPFIKKLVDKDILTERDLDAKRLRPFRITAKKMELGKSGQRWAFGPLGVLDKMARAMSHLLEFSLGMFHSSLDEMVSTSGKSKAGAGGANSIANNFEFQRLQRDVSQELSSIKIGRNGKTGADRHPKMQKALELMLAHFSQAEEEENTLGQKNNTRAMVFCSLRTCVMELVDMFNEHPNLLRATKFVGQAHGKDERDKGFNQKEQKKTINEFKAGRFNILVSTSIGEEGLDIGEVDFVVLYDMPKQSIKLLQRIGRTGRKRDGIVHVLMSENREDTNWDTAQQTHRDIQEEILHSRNLELFEDVEPLIPNRRMPECLEQVMPVDPWNPDDPQYKKMMDEGEKELRRMQRAHQPPVSRKKKKPMVDEVPVNARGFTSVRDLLREADKVLLRPDTEEEDEEAGGSKSKGKDKSKAKAKDPAVPKIKHRARKRARTPSPIQTESEAGEDQSLEALFAAQEKEDHTGEPSSKRKAPVAKAALITKRPRKSSPDLSTSSSAETKSVGRTFFSTGVSTLDALKAGHGAVSDADLDNIPVSPPPAPFSKAPTSQPPSAFPEHAKAIQQKTIQQKRAEAAEKRRLAEARAAEARQKHVQRPLQQQNQQITEQDQAGLDFFHAEGPLRRGLDPPVAASSSSEKALSLSPEKPRFSSPSRDTIDDEIVLPRSPQHVNTGITASSKPTGNKLSPRTAAAAGFSQIDPIDLSWDDDDDEADAANWQVSPSRPVRPLLPKTPCSSVNTRPDMPPPPIPTSAKKDIIVSSPFAPPSVPRSMSTPVGDTQFPVRRLGMARRRVILPSSEDNDSPVGPSRNTNANPSRAQLLGGVVDPDSSPMVAMGGRRGPGRLRRRIAIDTNSSPVRDEPSSRFERPRDRMSDRERRREDGRQGGKKKKKGPIGNFMDLDAELSGNDSGDTSEHSASSVATSSDLNFANDFAATQAPKGYNQQAVYLAGLSTQALGHGLQFKRDIAKEREEFIQRARRPVYITDEEDGGPRGRNSEDEYELGSFIVDDDEDVGVISLSDPLFD